MKQLTIQPIVSVSGQINIPGSKSLSNRVLLLAALAEGETLVRNTLQSDDTRRMLDALSLLGTNIQPKGQNTFLIKGNGGPFLRGKEQNLLSLTLGNAGTAMRPLTAVLCAGDGVYTLSGDPRMHERPIGHLIDSLRGLGAQVRYTGKDGFPPLELTAHGLVGANIVVDGSISSQFLTALLMAAPMAKGSTTISVKGELVSRPYIDLTIAVLKQFGVRVEEPKKDLFMVVGDTTFKSPGTIMVEGDASSASYFLAAAAIKGGTIRVSGIGKHSVQGDAKFAIYLEKMGATVAYGNDYVEVTKGELNGIDADFNEIPDAAMTIAVAALFAKGRTVIRNIYNWRVKETDRLAAMSTELRKVGAMVEEGHDFIAIDPPTKIKSAEIDTYDDHRMAMCFSLAALGPSPITINDPDCTAKTFPTYFRLFESIVKR
jgi:3-phosphoshikimate 1-carboxyvinyltransferase